MGAAAQSLIPALQESAKNASALDAFLVSVDGASAATQPAEMRAAAAEALEASSLLQVSGARPGRPSAPPEHAMTQVHLSLPAFSCSLGRSYSHMIGDCIASIQTQAEPGING